MWKCLIVTQDKESQIILSTTGLLVYEKWGQGHSLLCYFKKVFSWKTDVDLWKEIHAYGKKMYLISNILESTGLS